MHPECADVVSVADSVLRTYPMIFDALLDGLRAAPGDGEQWLKFAKACLDLTVEEQNAWAERALAIAPAAEIGYLTLAECWARAGMGNRSRDPSIPRRGVALLERCLREVPAGPDRLRIHSHLSFLYNELGCYALGERHGRLSAGNPNAIWHFSLTEALYRQHKFGRDQLCAVDLSPVATPAIQALADAVGADHARRPYEPSADYVVLLSVDAVYFNHFAAAQILGADQLGSRVRFHVHVINPDDEARRTADRLRDGLPPGRVMFSWEQLDQGDENEKRVHYCCSRFLLARELFERTRANIIIADADILYRREPEDIVASAKEYDVALCEFEGEPISNRYNASFVLLRQGLHTALFVRFLDHFLRVNLERHRLWMIDQIALYCCADRLERVAGGAFRLLRWPETVLSIHHTPDADIWSGATVAKWTDSGYSAYRQQILARGLPTLATKRADALRRLAEDWSDGEARCRLAAALAAGGEVDLAATLVGDGGGPLPARLDCAEAMLATERPEHAISVLEAAGEPAALILRDRAEKMLREKRRGFGIVTYTNSNCADVWPVYFGQLDRFLPNLPRFALSDVFLPEKYCRHESTFIYSDDNTFSSHWTDALACVEWPYILYMQEDYILHSPVDPSLFADCIDVLESNPRYSFVRLLPSGLKKGSRVFRHDLVEVDHEDSYPFSMQASVWRKRDLVHMLNTVRIRSIREESDARFKDFFRASGMLGLCKTEIALPYVITGVVNKKWNFVPQLGGSHLRQLLAEYGIDPERRGYFPKPA